MRSRSRCMLDKSLDAMLAAIEIYNKPRFPYRDESFAVLAINAWELVLKARLLQLGRNKLSVIVDKEKRRNQSGELSRKRYVKRNRSGNVMTIGLFKAFDRLANDFGETIPPQIRSNIEALCEIRDNSVHFFNDCPLVEKRVNEVGAASAKNYLNVTRQWFGVDFSDYNLSLLPIAFLRNFRRADGVSTTPQEDKVIRYIESIADADDPDDDFNVALHVEVRMKRTKDGDATAFQITRDPDAIPITIEEADIRATYPWDYNILTKRLTRRYKNFKANQQYHSIRKPLESDERFANERFLDPGNPKSARKTFYNPNILAEFDKHYERAEQSDARRAADGAFPDGKSPAAAG